MFFDFSWCCLLITNFGVEEQQLEIQFSWCCTIIIEAAVSKILLMKTN